MHKLLPLHVTNPIGGETVVLVAGGAGFVGSYLCEKLLTQCRVICLDNLRYGKRENLATCLGNENFTFIEYDIARPIKDLLRKKVDYVFHVAGVDEVVRHKKASLDDLLVNTYGTRNLLEKAVSDHAKFLLVSTLLHEKNIDDAIDTAQARLFSESMTIEYGKKFGVNTRIIRVGHLFGPRMPLDTALPAGRQESPMSIILHDVLKTGEVVLASDQFTRIYPVYINDCISIILQTIFSHMAHGKIFNLIPAQSVTLLELSEIIKDVDPNFRLRFDSNGHVLSSFAKDHFAQGSTLPLPSRSAFVNQLKETIDFFRSNQPGGFRLRSDEKSVYGKIIPRVKNRFSIRLNLPYLMLIAFLLTTVFPFLLFLSTCLIGLAQLNSAFAHLQDGKLSQATRTSEISHMLFTGSKSTLGFLSIYFSLIGRQKEYDTIFLLIKTGDDASIATRHVAKGGILLSDFFKKSIAGDGVFAKSTLDEAISEVNAAWGIVVIIEKEFEDIATTHLPGGISDYVEAKKTILSEHKSTITTAKTFTTLLPDLLGFESKRTYLILLQNNMELRPTGGFIGSYGLVTFENGSLVSFDVFDVYSADGQLRGHVEPPLPIRKYLNQPNWFLRDSNWDPDFQNAARQAAWFLEKETGVSPHGVIAVDVSLAQFLLEAIGPIALPDYKETITAENLFERAQAHTQTDFFPGSTQKKDFLGSLSRRIVDRLLHEEHVPWLSVFSAVKRGVLEKHLLFSFNNEAIQQVFTLNNWAGNILTMPQKEGQFSDFRMITEANLGVNKANYAVKRKIHDEIVINDDGSMTGALTIQYTNEGIDTPLGSSYINYLRTYFPQNTKLTALELDGKEASISSKGKDIELEEATQSGKTVFGFLVTVAPKTTKSVILLYELPETYPAFPGSTTYDYVFQKQPGTREDSLTVLITYPVDLRVRNTNAQVFQEKQTVALSSNLAEDRLFEVEFLR